jgi:hypothetical protein
VLLTGMMQTPRPATPSRPVTPSRRRASRSRLRPALVLATAGALVATTGAAVRAASDEPEIQSVELRLEGGHYTAKALSRDTDGDGWTDWFERLHGTDPKDPASHPLASHVEIVGTTAYVQSRDLPDHLVVIDLALPEGTTKTADLMALVGDLVGLSPTGKLREQLTAGLAELGSGRLEEILKLADEAHGSVADGGFPGRTNGMDVSLISAGPNDWEAWKKVMEAVTFVQNNDIGVGTTTDGDPYVTVHNRDGSQTHVFGGEGVSSTLINQYTLDDGTTVQHWESMQGGVVVGYGKKVTKADGSQEYWEYDKDGNLTAHGTAKTPPKSPAPAPAPTATAGGAPAPSSQPSSQPTSEPEPSSSASSDPAPSATSSGEYVNPDADPLLLPTRGEIEKRIAFLSGVRVRIVQDGPQSPEAPIVDEPGVADPADPECEHQMCPMFVVVSSPDLSDVNGGDPINPDHAPWVPGQGFYGSSDGSGDAGFGEGAVGWDDPR